MVVPVQVSCECIVVVTITSWAIEITHIGDIKFAVIKIQHALLIIGVAGEIRTHGFWDLQSHALDLSATATCWYLVTVSNRRPAACKAAALPLS